MIGTFKFNDAKLYFDFKKDKYCFEFDVSELSKYAAKEIINEIKDGETYVANIDFEKRKRTLDQNAYMWVLCDRIAAKIGTTKTQVYQKFVKEVGVFDVLCILERAKDTFEDRWSKKGIGWFCEETESKLDGCVNLICYCGSSCYTTEQMKRLLDEIIMSCKELKIPTEVRGYEEETTNE